MSVKRNVTLIGMPGAGKSTVGVVLAKILGYHFLDSDLEIQEQTGKLLHELITEHGDEGFLEIENRVNAGLAVDKTVIATGGSAVFGEDAMKHLQEISTVVYLRLPYKSLKRRLGDLKKRGVVLKPGQTLNIDTDTYQAELIEYNQPTDVLLWIKGKLMFKQNYLLEITNIMEKLYDIKFIYEDETLKTERFTGEFSTDSTSDEILNVLMHTHHFSYKKEGRTIRLRKR